tara:strand:+ start:243 stop:1163 length:921 start_codon:yes stop_codon:yes gene_type:complete
MGVIVGSSGTGSEGHSNRMSLPTGTSDPGSAAAGDMYYKTDTKKIRIYDGSAWADLASGGGSSYTSGAGSGLLFDCDFGRLGYSDNQNIGGSTSLSSALEHSTTDWSSSSSNSPIQMDGGSFNYKTANGGHIDTYSNNCRISVGAGSGNPAMSDKLNACSSMCVEGWYMYNGSGRDVLVSRYGGGFPNQWNHIVDPGGQFHFNSSGPGCGSGDRDWDAFGDNVWFHCIWQYHSGTHYWWVNNSQKGTTSSGSSLAVSSQTGFGIGARADDWERLEGKIAIVRIYNRILTNAEIASHWNAEKARFGL